MSAALCFRQQHSILSYQVLLLLLLLQGELGELLPGAAADLILVDGDPLQDIGCLAGSSSGGGGSNIPLVIKDGLLAKVGGDSQGFAVGLTMMVMMGIIM
jgi:hypothetical protein